MAEMSYFEYDEKNLYGTWRISKFKTFDEPVDATSNSENEIKGTEMTLEDTNEVRWKTPDEVEAIPLFSCESYEVILTNPAQLTFVSTSIGRIGPFSAEFEDVDHLQLTYDKAFVLFCDKVPQSEQIQEAPFSFLPALERGYFSDLVITSSSGKNFHAHKVVMSLGCPEQKWNSCRSSTSKQTSMRSYQACILDGMSNSVLRLVLHFLYCESLPANLPESEARECMDAVAKISGLEKLAKLCSNYLDNHAVQTKIDNLCDEVELCGKKINKLIDVRIRTPGVENSAAQSEPAVLFHAIKQSGRELAIALIKVVQLCKLFADHRNELSREERHRIMKRCRSRLPNLLDLCAQFFEIVLSHLGEQTHETRTEVASHFLTEAEPLFDLANELVFEVRQALEAMIDSDFASKHKQKESIITRTLKNAVHIKELAKLRRLHGEMVEFINNLLMKREHFALLSRDEKIQAVCNVMECTADEIPISIDRILNLNENLESRLSWTRFKYFFKMLTSKAAWIVEKSRHSRHSLSKAIQTIRKLMLCEEFDAGLASLGLIDCVDRKSPASNQGSRISRSSKPHDIESLSIPPVPRDSLLSARSKKLLNSPEVRSEYADMKFVVHYEKDGQPSTEIIEAHRVIVACRCDWFRKALLSGMKEDIKREINVYDCNPDMFMQFLQYLYTGRLDCSETSIDTLAEMIALSDRYEVDALKCVCEGALRPHITSDNVLELLSIGEQYNAASLRECCMEFILEHPAVLESNLFNQLPPRLQIEVRELTEWNQRDQLKHHSPTSYHSSRRSLFCMTCQQLEPLTPAMDSGNDLSSEMERIDQLTNALHFANDSESEDSGDGGDHFLDNISVDEIDMEVSLEACIAGLQKILGDEVPRDELVRLSIAANFDVNLAVNLYFSS